MPENATWGVGRTGPPSTFSTKMAGIADSIFSALEKGGSFASSGMSGVFTRLNQALTPINEAANAVGGVARTIGVTGSAMGGGSKFDKLAEFGTNVQRGVADMNEEFTEAQMDAVRELNAGVRRLRETGSMVQSTIASGGRADFPDADSVTPEQFLAMSKADAMARFGLSSKQYDEFVARLKRELRAKTSDGRTQYSRQRKPPRLDSRRETRKYRKRK